MMNQVPMWDDWALDDVNAPTLVQLKEIAVWLLQYPPETRRRLIDQYDAFFDGGGDDSPALRIYILLRLLFDVPEFYPSGAARDFGCGWFFVGESGLHHEDWSDPASRANLLWPVGYKGDHLVLKGVPVICQMNCGSDCINSAAYFDWYAAHFRTREVDELS